MIDRPSASERGARTARARAARSRARSHALGACGVALALAALDVGGGCARTSAATSGVRQPVAFDHERHARENLTCEVCHAQAQNGEYATFPELQKCLLCHKEAQGSHPDEPLLRAYAERGEELPWVTLNRVAGHVHFSHAAHVRFARMDCAECHGDMAHATEPPSATQIGHLTMTRCMECHAERGASNDCITCHK